jgi:hypothetical protein
MVIIDTVLAPPSAQQNFIAQPPPPKPPRFDAVDEEIIGVLRRAGRYGLLVWRLLDDVATVQNPTTREERRSLRLDAWQRLRRLLRQGLVHRFGRKVISLWKLPHLSVRRRRRIHYWLGGSRITR